MLEEPIVRLPERIKKDPSKQTAKYKSWSQDCYRSALAASSIRAGYDTPWIPYDIRRGASNTIHEDPSYTADQLRQILGHRNPKAFRKSYLSRASKVNLFACVQDDPNDFNEYVAELHRIPRTVKKEEKASPPHYDYTRAPLDGIRLRADLCLHKTKVDLLHKVVVARGVVREASQRNGNFDMRESIKVVEALMELCKDGSRPVHKAV